MIKKREFCLIGIFLIVFLSACAAGIHGWTTSDYSGKILSTNTTSGTERLTIERNFDINVDIYIEQNGIPEYIYVVDLDNLYLFYTEDDYVVGCYRPNWDTKSNMRKFKPIPKKFIDTLPDNAKSYVLSKRKMNSDRKDINDYTGNNAKNFNIETTNKTHKNSIKTTKSIEIGHKQNEVSLTSIKNRNVQTESSEKEIRIDIFQAAKDGNIDELKVAIANAVNINKKDMKGKTALWYAVVANNAKIVKYLLENGANANVKVPPSNGTPLQFASIKGFTEIAKLLLDAGSEVNVFDKSVGVTPLWLASQGGHTDIVKILIENKADVNLARKGDKVTSLLMASQEGHTNIVKLLLEAKADVNGVSNDGTSPLLSATQGGNIDIVKLLLSYGADVNKSRNNGVSPLHIAANNGDLEIAELLIKAKADLKLKLKSDGTILLDIAIQKGHPNMIELLSQNVKETKLLQNIPKNIVLEAQKRLLELGYNPGKIDGIMGEITQVALREYQNDHNLPKTGIVDKKTAKALNIPFVNSLYSSQPKRNNKNIKKYSDNFQIPFTVDVKRNDSKSRAEVKTVEGVPLLLVFSFDCPNCGVVLAHDLGDNDIWASGAIHIYKGESVPSSYKTNLEFNDAIIGEGGRIFFKATSGTILSQNRIAGWKIESSTENPITFKVIDGVGYVHISGKGIVKSPNGEVFRLK